LIADITEIFPRRERTSPALGGTLLLPTVSALDHRWYPEFKKNWDNLLFRDFILQRIDREARILDYGAGRGHVEQMNFKGLVEFVAGVDPDPAVHENPYLDEARVLPLPSAKIPYEDNSFDVVFADNVMEHVADPIVTFQEVRRVLKPGGIFIAKTPNKWHYMPLIARCTPTSFHKAVNRRRGREVHDTFPTCYRCNSAGDVRTLAKVANMEVRLIRRIEGWPEYLRFNAMTYACGYLFERCVNATSALEMFRCVLLFEVAKPAASPQGLTAAS
jgi:SAM-dependent methyltransferase